MKVNFKTLVNEPRTFWNEAVGIRMCTRMDRKLTG